MWASRLKQPEGDHLSGIKNSIFVDKLYERSDEFSIQAIPLVFRFHDHHLGEMGIETEQSNFQTRNYLYRQRCAKSGFRR